MREVLKEIFIGIKNDKFLRYMLYFFLFLFSAISILLFTL
jgi:hypothetical protein